MKCPECDAWTEVEATRPHVHGTTRRKRKCANGHKFFSVEIPEKAFTRAQPALKQSFYTISMRKRRYARNVKIAQDPRPAKEAAETYHLHHSEIRKIRARHKKGLL